MPAIHQGKGITLNADFLSIKVFAMGKAIQHIESKIKNFESSQKEIISKVRLQIINIKKFVMRVTARKKF
jgi:hypothetical protein